MENYQIMPDLTEQEYEALKENIAERGVVGPIEFDEDGNCLDGYNRLKACNELGIMDYPKVIQAGLNEEEKDERAYTLNLARRHLTHEQKIDVAKCMTESIKIKLSRGLAMCADKSKRRRRLRILRSMDGHI